MTSGCRTKYRDECRTKSAKISLQPLRDKASRCRTKVFEKTQKTRRMEMTKFKPYMPYILLLLLGLAISGFFYFQLNSKLEKQKSPTVQIVVPAKDIPAYKEITTADIKLKEVPEEMGTEDIAKTPETVLGFYADTTLYAELPIKLNRIIKDKNILNRDIVAINIDYVRSAAAKPGDIVDVYFIKAEAANWTAVSSEKVASDVIVISIEDADGNRPEKGKSKTAVAVLAVSPAYTDKVVPGAIKDNTRYVLSVKNRPQEMQQPQPALQEGN
jgi:Flp pilus assembly protein CpaB